jgi:hypothetical protein
MIYTDEEGILALIYLQALAGFTETEKMAMAGWGEITQSERDYTIAYARLLKERGFEAKEFSGTEEQEAEGCAWPKSRALN